jgi:hypothetical protein
MIVFVSWGKSTGLGFYPLGDDLQILAHRQGCILFDRSNALPIRHRGLESFIEIPLWGGVFADFLLRKGEYQHPYYTIS